MNILERANQIMNTRSEEKNREYGPFVESIERAAIIADQICDVKITPETFCKCLIALKIGRIKFNIKDDTLLDAVAYLDGLQKIRDAKKEEKILLIKTESYIQNLCPTDWENFAKVKKDKDEENE